MAKVKYRIREFKPTANQTGGHSDRCSVGFAIRRQRA